MNIHIICVGKLRERYLKDASAEYIKRLSRFCRVKVTEITDEPLSEKHSHKELLAALDKEGEGILAAINKADFVVSLCIEGKQMTSEDFSEIITENTLAGKSNFVFIIGGSIGLSESVKRASSLKLSFSKMTFPHQLMRVILLEQVYRAFKINSNESYHK